MSHRTRGRQRRLHTIPDQRALLVAATRRGPAADPRDEELTVMRIPTGGPARTHIPPREVASHLTDDRRIAPSFEDIAAADDLRLFHMPADWVPARGADQLDHAAVIEVTSELAASVGRHAAPRKAGPETPAPAAVAAAVPEREDLRVALRDVEISHAELQMTFVPGILLVVDDAAAELELAIVRLACAISDVQAARGRQLVAATGCCPEWGGRFELDKGQIPTHYPTGDPRPCRGAGSEPEGSAR